MEEENKFDGCVHRKDLFDELLEEHSCSISAEVNYEILRTI